MRNIFVSQTYTCTFAQQMLHRIKKLNASHIKSWFDNSTRLIESLLSDEPTRDDTSIAIQIQCIPEGQDQLRRELFGSCESLGPECKMSFHCGFMHIAFQVLPITEIILRGNFASESIAGLEESVRALMKSLKPMATHIDRFWGHFGDDMLGVFHSHLSACVSSVVSLASKLSWSHDVVPHELEEYILDEHFIKMSNSERKVSTKRYTNLFPLAWLHTVTYSEEMLVIANNSPGIRVCLCLFMTHDAIPYRPSFCLRTAIKHRSTFAGESTPQHLQSARVSTLQCRQIRFSLEN